MDELFMTYGIEQQVRSNNLMISVYPPTPSGAITRKRPDGRDFQYGRRDARGAVVPEYLERMRAAGLDDPVGGDARYRQALDLLEQSRDPEFLRDARVSREENASRRREAVLRLEGQARGVYSEIVRSLYDIGDGFLDLIRPVVENAIGMAERGDDRAAEALWTVAQDLAEFLRSVGIVSSAVGAAPEDYGLKRADRAFYWRIATGPNETRSQWQDGNSFFYLTLPLPAAPTVTLATAIRHGWEPGLYDAAEVIGFAQERRAAFDRALVDARPAPRQAVRPTRV